MSAPSNKINYLKSSNQIEFKPFCQIDSLSSNNQLNRFDFTLNNPALKNQRLRKTLLISFIIVLLILLAVAFSYIIILKRNRCKKMGQLNTSTMKISKSIYKTLSNGLTNYWTMNNLNDSKGGANVFDGDSFEFVEDRFGRPNSAIRFNFGYLQVPSGVYFNGDLTVSVWAKLNTNGAWSRIIDFGNGPDLNNVLFSVSYQNPEFPTFYTWNRQFKKDVTSKIALPLDQWVHLAYTLNGKTGTIYMNGLKTTEVSTFVPEDVIRKTNFIGKSHWSHDKNLNGDLDELRFYNRALNQTEIYQLYASTL